MVLQDLRLAEDGERHVACDLAFHGAIAGLANHAVLRALVDALPDPVLLDPVARLGREQWARLGTVFELKRPGAPPPRA